MPSTENDNPAFTLEEKNAPTNLVQVNHHISRNSLRMHSACYPPDIKLRDKFILTYFLLFIVDTKS